MEVALRGANTADVSATSPAPPSFAGEAADLVVALRAAGLAVWRLDLESNTLTLSEAARGILECDAKIPWSSWLERVGPEDRAGVDTLRASLEAAPSDFRLEFSFRPQDGEARALFVTGGMVRDDTGALVGVVGTVIDQTAAKLAQARTNRMVGALQHRGKNVVAMVRSIANRTLAASDDLEDFGAHFDGRLSALARVQTIVSRSDLMVVDLEELIREELLHSAQEDERVSLEGPPVRLEPKVAELLGLAIHELVMNAVKFGALSTPRGRISVEWTLDNDGSQLRLDLSWRESGVSLIDPAPRTLGFGRELIERGLPYQLGGTTSLTFAPGGLRCRLEIPVGC